MKVTTLLPLAVTAAAIVLPDPDVMQQIAIEDNSKQTLFDQFQATKNELQQSFEDTVSTLFETSKNVLDEAFDWAATEFKTVSDDFPEEYFDAKAWIASSCNEIKNLNHDHLDHPPHDGPPPPPPPPHHGPPRDGRPPPPPPPPHHGPPPPHDKPPHDRPPHDRPGHKRPHHPPHHRPHKSNYTVYQLINHSKYTTKLAELINQDSSLVKLLNGTSANFTIFAPTDEAFSKIPDHHKKPSEEFIKKLLAYHVSGEFYPAGRILVSKTIPSLLEGTYLSPDPKDTPQRLSTNIGFRGLTINFYSRVVAPDIFGSNGVIHGIDSILLPPPGVARIITLLPSEFSTLELALRKTELFNNTGPTEHYGGTAFAPTNWAFTKLGPKINAFLFSEYGRKYLKALLQYHVVLNQTLYSDAYYSGTDSESTTDEKHRIPKGKFHIDLPTQLEGKHLSIDIGRFGRLIDIRINGFAHVSTADGVANDGVIHTLNNVLIPPKKVGGTSLDYQGEDLTVEDLKERLAGYIEDSNDEVEEEKHDL